MSSPSPCPLCDSTPERMFPQAHDWLVRCPRCRLGFADPQPTDAQLAEIYSAEYYSQFGYQQGAADAALARIKRATYGRFLRSAEKFTGKPAPGRPRRLLEVGCGLGYSLLAGEARGWEVAGLEPHAMAGAGLPAHLAAKMVRGTLDSYRPPEPLDLVSLIDVIEHVRDPLATIRQAADLLRPGGVLMLATNDVTSRSARRLGPRWVHFHRAHLWYFSPATLTRAVEKAGLTPLGVRTAWRVYNLQYVASILATGANFPLARMMARLSLKLTPRFLRLMSWPPLPEGMVVLARREG
ncbi:MAG: class I SAM-dependent methyltransferase [Phycisphaerae bacterium]|nr:class I SAM-dependent methyltransferase [Phycisphaerae bacterium]